MSRMPADLLAKALAARGFMPPDEGDLLHDVALEALTRGPGLEVGTYCGKSAIYLGAAAGVGKTFAMLNEGRRRAEYGEDVVVGFVETHGRRKTADQIAGLEVVPRNPLPYRESVFEEMDVDAVLARRPRTRRASAEALGAEPPGLDPEPLHPLPRRA